MAENEGTGGEGGAGGVGLDINVVLTPQLNPKQMEGSFSKEFASTTDRIFTEVVEGSQGVTQAMQGIQDFITKLAGSSRRLGRNAKTKQILAQISNLDKIMPSLQGNDTIGQFGGKTADFSSTVAQVGKLLGNLTPQLTRKGTKGRAGTDANKAYALLEQANSAIGNYNNQVTRFGHRYGMGVEGARPGKRQVVGGPTDSYTDSKAASNINLFKSRFERDFKSASKVVGPTKGISLDVETANWKNDIYTMAFKTQKDGMVTMQRDLKKDKVRLSKFHAGYAEGVTKEAGSTAAQIVSKFYDAYSGTAGPGGLSARNLPPITGHNVDFDLRALKQMADGVVTQLPKNDFPNSQYNKAAAVASTMRRLLPGGDNRAVAEEGDTAKRWAKFMQEDLGYSSHAAPGSGKQTMGNSLGAIMKGLGVGYDAHDASADTRATDFLRRSLDSKGGKTELKKMFNYDRWVEASYEASVLQEMSVDPKKGGVPKNMRHLIKPAMASGIVPNELSPYLIEAKARAHEKVTNLDQQLRGQASGEVEVNSPDAVKKQMISDNARAATDLRQHLNRQLDATTKGKDLSQGAFSSIIDNIVSDTDTQAKVNKVLDSYNLGDNKTKRDTAKANIERGLRMAMETGVDVQEKTYAAKDQAAGKEAGRFVSQAQAGGYKESIDADGYSVDQPISGETVKLSNAGDRDTFIKNALDNSFIKDSSIPVVKQRTKTLKKSDLRVSDLAAMGLDRSNPSRRSEGSLIEQFRGETTVPDLIPKSAADRGNAFEDKAVEAITGKFGDRYEAIRTGKDQATLKLGDFSGHPDGYLYDKVTKERTLFEAKYRGVAEREEMQRTGQLPPNYLRQASAYALASGTPDLPTTFAFGDLQDNAEIRALDKASKDKSLTAKKRAEMETKLREARANVDPTKLDLGSLEMVRVAPDRDIQKAILSDISNITGQKVDFSNYKEALKIPTLAKDIQKFLAGGGKLSSSPDALNDLIAQRTKDLKRPTDGRLESTILQAGPNMADKIRHAAQTGGLKLKPVSDDGATNTMAIGSGGGPTKPPKPPRGGGGGGDDGNGDDPDVESVAGKAFNPKIGFDLADQIKLVSKELEKATFQTEKARLSGESKKEFIRRTQDSGRVVKDHKLISDSAKEDFDFAAEKRREAQGLTAQLEKLKKRQYSQTGTVDADVERKDRIQQGADQILDKRSEKAQAAALTASATIKADGLNNTNIKAAMDAAKELSKYGLEGKEGYSRKELFKMANKDGIGFDDLQLKELGGGAKTQANLSGVQGKTGVKALKLDAIEATKAVDGLFKQLADNTGSNFMSDESKSIQEFITKSQEATKTAASMREKAAQARHLAGEERAKPTSMAAANAGAFEKEAKAADKAAVDAEAKALDLARQAEKRAKDMTSRTTTVGAHKENLLEGRELEKEKILNRQRQMKAQSQMPGFTTSRAFRDEDSLLRRRLTSLNSGKEMNAQRFSPRSEVTIATQEAKASLDAFTLKAQQKAIRLKVDLDLQGMTPEVLQSTLRNNLDLAKQGVASPGTTTNDILNQALRNGTSITGSKTQGYTGYFDALGQKAQPQILGGASSPFDDLMAQNKMAEQTVKSLYSSLNAGATSGAGLGSVGKALFDQEANVRKSIDAVKERYAAADILDAEAKETKDPTQKADTQDQANNMRAEAAKAELAAKKQLLNLEKNLHAVRIDPSSLAAQQAQTAQTKQQLMAEKEQLIIERQRLNSLVKMDGGRHANTQNLGRLSSVNQTLANRFDTGLDKGGLSQAGINRVAKDKGIDRNEISGGKSKDFVGGAIDLLDWQLQWLAGVSILNAFSGAIKNSIGFAIQYEAALQNVKLITQANTVEMTDLTSEIERLATSFQYSASELAEGLIILGQAGFTAVESLVILPNITALATATMSNLKMATDVTTTAIEAFNVPMEKVNSLVNTLAAMTIESKLDIEKLGTSFNYIASTASAAGFSIEETGAAMGLMSNAGVRASTIGTSLRSAIGSLMNPTAKFRKALADVGLSAEDISPVTNRLGDIFVKLKESGFDVGSAFAGLDKRIAGGVITLVESANEFESFQGSITGTNRAFAMAEGQMDTFEAQVKRMRNSFQLLGGSWFEGDLEPLKEAAKVVTSIIKGLKVATDLIPDVGKSALNSTIALTTGLSLVKGVGGGIYDTVTNIRSGLRNEKKTFASQSANVLSKLGGARSLGDRKEILKEQRELFKSQRKGSTLSGRNQKVYSTFKTLFDPKMIGLAGALTVALIAVSAGIKNASGEAAVLANIELSDKFASEVAILESVQDSLKKTTRGTLEYARAMRQLKKIGLDVYNPDSALFDEQIETEVRNRRVGKDIADENLFKSRVTKMQSKQTALSNVFNDEDEQEAQDSADASHLTQFIKKQGLFFSGSEEQILAELEGAGFKTDTESVALDKTMEAIRTARNDPNAAANAAGEARSGLLDAVKRQDDGSKRFASLENKYQFFKDSGVGDHDKIQLDFYKEAGPVAGRLNAADRDVDRFAKDYIDNVIGSEGEARYSGSQQAAEDKLVDAFDVLKKSREKLEAAKDEPDDNRRRALTHLYSKEVKAAEKAMIVASRSKAFKVGLAGLSPDQVRLADDFMSLLTRATDIEGKGGVEVDPAGLQALQGVDVTALKDLSKKMAALNDKKLVEESELGTLVRDADGNLDADVQASINVKYKLQAEEITQAAMDSAFKPLQTVFNKITAFMQEQNKSLVEGLQSESTSDMALLDSTYADRGITGSFQATKIGRVGRAGTFDSRHIARGYSSGQKSQDKVELDTLKLRNKQTVDQAIYDSKSASNATIFEKQKEEIANRSYATEQRRNEDKLALELKYHQGVLALSRKRRDELAADLKTLDGIRSQHVDRISSIQGVADSARTSAGGIMDTVRAGRPDQTLSSASSVTRRAHKSYRLAKDLMKQNRFTEAKQAQDEAFATLSTVTSSDKYTQSDKEMAGRAAMRISDGMSFTADQLISAEKEALSVTEGLLTEIRNALTASGSGDVDGAGEETPKYKVAPGVKTTNKLTGETYTTKTIDWSDPKTGAEGIKTAEEKVKELEGASIDNQKTLEARLEASVKTLSDLNSGMVDGFIQGLTDGLPAIARQMGKDIKLGMSEQEAADAQNKKDIDAAASDASLNPGPQQAAYEVTIQENQFGIAMKKIIKNELTGVA